MRFIKISESEKVRYFPTANIIQLIEEAKDQFKIYISDANEKQYSFRTVDSPEAIITKLNGGEGDVIEIKILPKPKGSGSFAI